MAVLFDPGIFSVEGLAGDVLPGAQLFWYVSGTSTPLATYADKALTVPNTNPVIAGGDGRFPSIWLQSADYKLMFKSAAGVTLTTRDPISGISAIDVIAAPGGSASVGFLQAGTGAVGRTLQQELREFRIAVTEFGAVGAGADEYVSIQKAADRAAAMVASGFYVGQKVKPTLVFPQGMFFGTSKQIRIPNGVNIDMQSPLVVLAGAGAGPDTGTSWLKIGDEANNQGTRTGRFYLDVIRATSSNWSNVDDYGVELQGMAGCDITLARAVGFRVGMEAGAGGNCFGYNRTKLGEIRGAVCGVQITNDTGFFNNQNQWFGGEFANIGDGTHPANTSRYGFEFKAGNVAGYQDHHFYGQSYELNLTEAGTGEAVPVLINGPASTIVFHDQRSENCSDRKMVINANTSGRIEFNERYTQRGGGSSPWPGIVGAGIYDASLFRTSKVRSYMDELLKDALLVWDSGALANRVNQYDGSTAMAVGGVDICDSAYNLMAGASGITISGGAVVLSAGRNLVRQVDTTMNKRFVVLVNTGDPSKAWTLAVKPLDASGTLLSDNPTPPHIIGEDANAMAWNPAVIGGSYIGTGSFLGRAFYLSVDAATKSIALAMLGATGVQARSIQIYALDAPCATWTTTRAGFPDSAFVATTLPTETKPDGTRVYKINPAAGGIEGWARCAGAWKTFGVVGA